MKDRQVSRKVGSASIPLLSPVLHVLAMPVLVFLRYDFGYLVLRPKSIFLALVWAFVLYAVYSYFEPRRWNANPYVSVFGALCSVLFLIHLGRSIFSQWGKAPHDQFAGRSAFHFTGISEAKLFFWLEPIIVIGASLLFEAMRKGNSLSEFLGFAAVAMVLKELINRWFEVRKVKQQLDATADAEETMTKVASERDAGGVGVSTPSSPSRKARQKRDRIRKAPSEDLEAHAAALRMIPPYTLEQAEANFRSLVKEFHPDETEQDSEDGLVKLTIARDFFRAEFTEA